ncbi:YbdD/YjiX family protein [Acinetobacter indicus]|uniref:YbdD/YjiX family protein n=1 Tax=Acinetobacter indicus TaxID=756892 RepID=A0A6C0Y2Z2_9GAMM|nr:MULTISPECIES: YbdD/YjiX family protein [Acinetobacter]QFS17006.1 YbdD/YjiX family protein [Acinetobacter indicus]QIC70587.1 YbdD/YjiX family protein [Acinetobacter indicus]QIC73831.1 YbdD/YjiX family protein [Acinetobacter indicus]QIC75786.1 YbdD/YjiX family protein [Acinetobacter indicus]QOW41749.1 YbdD/YjiX family protein [Acinetobacter indicus]
MNLKFARAGKMVIYKIIKMTVMSQKDLILNPKNWSRIATLWQRLQQSFRLMVGVPDYQTYLEHMRQHHPDLEAMDAKTFYRHCVDSRYPSSGNLKKCPC